MKGIIFTVFSKMIEDNYGVQTLDQVLSETHTESNGVFTAASTYPDSDLVSLIVTLSKIKNLSPDILVRSFGKFLIYELHKKYPVFFKNKVLKNFLLSIHGVIHVEVKKIYPDADLPIFEYETPEENVLIMKYTSKRKMCILAEGLIEGASEILKEKIDFKHETCCKKGSPHCKFEITFKGF